MANTGNVNQKPQTQREWLCVITALEGAVETEVRTLEMQTQDRIPSPDQALALMHQSSVILRLAGQLKEAREGLKGVTND